MPECKLFTPDGDGRERKGEGDQSSRVIPGIFVQFWASDIKDDLNRSYSDHRNDDPSYQLQVSI